MVAIALAKAATQERPTPPSVLLNGIDTEDGQVPMGLSRPVMFRPLEGGSRVGLLFPECAFGNDRHNWSILAVNTRWQPERDARTVAGALCRTCLERACS